MNYPRRITEASQLDRGKQPSWQEKAGEEKLLKKKKKRKEKENPSMGRVGTAEACVHKYLLIDLLI